MITVIIKYFGNNGNAKKFMNEMIDNKIVEKIRNEKGNLGYEYFLPIEDDNYVLLMDSWDNQEALDNHHKLPIMKEIIKLREKYDLHMTVNKYYEINDEKDEKYIRR